MILIKRCGFQVIVIVDIASKEALMVLCACACIVDYNRHGGLRHRRTLSVDPTPFEQKLSSKIGPAYHLLSKGLLFHNFIVFRFVFFTNPCILLGYQYSEVSKAK